MHGVPPCPPPRRWGSPQLTQEGLVPVTRRGWSPSLLSASLQGGSVISSLRNASPTAQLREARWASFQVGAKSRMITLSALIGPRWKSAVSHRMEGAVCAGGQETASHYGA